MSNVVPATICVCSLSKLPDMTALLGARHVVTLIREHDAIPTPAGVAPENHLRIGINDIALPQEGLIHPTAHHVETVLTFVRAWPKTAPMIIHCWAGISRSTASAFIAQCALNPDADERQLALALRLASPTASPNPLMVEIADDLLVRRGKMIDALAAIGLGESAMEGIPFTLPAKVT
jgi:predicted protein tyrosine phosphatase